MKDNTSQQWQFNDFLANLNKNHVKHTCSLALIIQHDKT